MRNFLAALIVLTCVGYAQQTGGAERKMPPQAQPKTDDHARADDQAKKSGPAAAVRRLESVTWDPLQAQLTWVISVWDLDSDMSKPTALERYAIHVDKGLMESGGEQRPFEAPGSDIHALMSIISTYAMRSTIWWE